MAFYIGVFLESVETVYSTFWINVFWCNVALVVKKIKLCGNYSSDHYKN